MPPPTCKPTFEEEPIESQLEIFKLAEQFLHIQKQINQKASNFEFSDSFSISFVGEPYVREVFKVAKERVRTDRTHLEKVQHGIKVMEQQALEQKREQREMSNLLRECGDLNETVEKVLEKPLAKRRREGCDKLEEHALKVLKACKRFKGSEE